MTNAEPVQGDVRQDSVPPWLSQLGARHGLAVLPLLSLLVMVVLTQALLNNVIQRPPYAHATADSTAIAKVPCTTLVSADTAAARGGSLGFAERRARIVWAIAILFVVATLGATFAANLGLLEGAWMKGGAVLLVLLSPLVPPSDAWKLNANLLDCTVYQNTGARSFTETLQSISVAMLVLLAIAAGVVILRVFRDSLPADGDGVKLAEATRDLARHQRRIRLLLYIAAIALVAGTLEVSALYAWAASLVNAKRALGVDTSVISDTMGAVGGSYYSLLLATIFVPVFVALRNRAEEITDRAREKIPVVDQAKWFTENPIESSIPRQIISALAVLAPLIAGGPLTQLLAKLT
jgi:hypothetical protein